tara:strand:+ start:2422 stop:3282 length:861 start_codon:yes stop_codon:yes gene_type:complete
MGVEFKFRNPLIVQIGTGVTGSANGIVFTSKEFSAVNEDNVTFKIAQEVETTSNVQFNSVTSSGVVSIGSRLFLGDGSISSSNSVVAHTGSINVTDNIIVPSMSLNGKLTADTFEISVTGSTTIFDSGSSRFGDTLDDTHIVSGSTSISGSFGLKGTSINEISNDTTLADSSANAIVTENASTGYLTTLNVPNKLAYLRKSFTHTASIVDGDTAHFTAVTASAPTGITGTTEDDFMFFVNGMLVENDALTIEQSGSGVLKLQVSTGSLGYVLESDDEIVGFGKFNS